MGRAVGRSQGFLAQASLPALAKEFGEKRFLWGVPSGTELDLAGFIALKPRWKR